MAIWPASSDLVACSGGGERAEFDAKVLIKVVEALQGAVDEDRRVPAGLAQQANHTLGLPEAVGADDMAAFGKLSDRV